MKNGILKATVPITLDKRRNMLIDFNALALIEERTGRSIMEANVWSSMKVGEIRLVLWAALTHEDEAITEEHVGSLVSVAAIPYVVSKVSQAFQLSLSQQTATPVPQPQQAARPLAQLPQPQPAAITG